MKNIYKYIFISIFPLCISGCSDFLDKYPLDSVTHETFWKTESQLRAALYPCYEGFKFDLIINMGESCGETVIWGDLTSGLSKVPGGRHTANDGFPFTSYWRFAYASIFTCNNYLDNYNRAEIPQNVKDVYAAEVKVIRALQYFWLTSVWGDVPWIDHVITSEEAYGPRTEKDKIIDYILDDLTWAASKLGKDRQLGENVGRIDRWGALALKARIALQNGRWSIAAEAAKEVIDKGPYGLYSYEKIYHIEGDTETDPNNNESIIYSMYVPDVRMNNMTNFTCCPVDYIRLNASKTLVDAYLCIDGKPAKAGLEYYKRDDIETSPLYTNPEQHYEDYFKNRDPRMALTLYTPGDKWPGGDDGDKENKQKNEIFMLPRFAPLQANNKNGANSRTGFYFKKYNTPEMAGQANKSHSNINVIRFPEVLLTYAEAMFELQGKTLTQEQIDYTINKLRDRVGMHRMNLSELKEWNLDLETELRRERHIEMTFDGMRYFDILRWREGWRLGRAVTGPSEQVCLRDLGANPYVGNGVDEFGDIIYEKSVAEGGLRNFDPSKHYLWPVPYEERVKNPSLGQNPGWE